MKNLEAHLIKYGLTETEAAIYLAGLSYEAVDVNELTKQTRINRTTIYHALDTLKQKGLIAKKISGQKQLFEMTPPSDLEKVLNEKIKEIEFQKTELKNLLPLLDLPKKNSSSVKVSHYEGIEGIKVVVEEALYCKSHHWDIIAPRHNFFFEFEKDYAKYFLEARKNRGIMARSLWEAVPSQQLLTPNQLQGRNPRILPEVMHGKFKSVIILFDDQVAIISSIKLLSAILIKSKELSETMQTIFEGLWSVSKEL